MIKIPGFQVEEKIYEQDLKTLLKIRTFTLRQLLKIATDTARILGQIHAANLIHGDIKPANYEASREKSRGPLPEYPGY